MNHEALDAMLELIRQLPPAERVAFADAVDRLAWRDRVQVVLETIRESVAREGNPPSDDEIDAIVNEVRSESSLFRRYWTRPRSSAA